MSADPHYNLSSGPAGASDESIQQVHDDLLKPASGTSRLPLVILGLVEALVFVAAFYVYQYSGGFSPSVYDERYNPSAVVSQASGSGEPSPEQVVAAGKKSFQAVCATCHQVSGLGVPGVYPPLVGSEFVVGNEERVVRILLHGMNGPVEVAGKTYNGAMPAFGKVTGGGYNWNEEKISQVLTYIRQEWGNKAAPVTKAKVAEVLAKEAARAKSWTAGELESFK